MTKCEQIQDLLPSFLEGVLSSDKKRLVREHLAMCQQCSAALEEQKRTVLLVQNLDEVEPPPWFAQKVMSKVREEAAGSPVTEHRSLITGIISKLFYPLHVKVPIQALASALIVVLALYLYRSVEPEMKIAQAPSEVARGLTAQKKELQQQYDKAGAGTSTAENESVPGPRREKAAGTITETRTETAKKAEKEEATPPAGLAAQRAKVEKKEAVADRQVEEMRTAASSPGQRAVSPVQKVPPPVLARGGAENKVSTGLQGKMEEAHESSIPQAARQAKTVTAKKTEPIGIALCVNDVTAAVDETRQFLSQLGARSVAAESRDGIAVITAELAVDKIEELFRKLAPLGQVEEKGHRPATTEGFISIRIEVTGKP
jgi:hypothetical protein